MSALSRAMMIYISLLVKYVLSFYDPHTTLWRLDIGPIYLCLIDDIESTSIRVHLMIPNFVMLHRVVFDTEGCVMP